MQDRPTTTEILAALRHFLEAEVLPQASGDALRFRVRVAMNLLRIAARDVEFGREHLEAEWRRLNRLFGQAPPPPPGDAALRAALLVRREVLAARIRCGAAPPGTREALEAGLRAQLAIANPDFLARFIPR